jgi:hypothetical protein
MERGKPWANAVEVLSSTPAASAARDSFFKIWLLVQVPTAGYRPITDVTAAGHNLRPAPDMTSAGYDQRRIWYAGEQLLCYSEA